MANYNKSAKAKDAPPQEEERGTQWEQWNQFIEKKVGALTGEDAAKKPLFGSGKRSRGYQDETSGSSRDPPPVQNTHKNIVASSDLLAAKTKEMKKKSSKNIMSLLSGGSSAKLTASSNVSAASDLFPSSTKRADSYLAQNSYDDDSKASEEVGDDDSGKIGYFSPSPAKGSKFQTPSPVGTNASGSAPTSAGDTVVPNSGKKKMPPSLDLNKIGVAPKHIKAPSAPGGSRPGSANPPPSAKKYKPEEKELEEQAAGGKKLGRKAPSAGQPRAKQGLKLNDVS
jgi:hypothetical protein